MVCGFISYLLSHRPSFLVCTFSHLPNLWLRSLFHGACVYVCRPCGQLCVRTAPVHLWPFGSIQPRSVNPCQSTQRNNHGILVAAHKLLPEVSVDGSGSERVPAGVNTWYSLLMPLFLMWSSDTKKSIGHSGIIAAAAVAVHCMYMHMHTRTHTQDLLGVRR